ncbi:MAG: bifunctional chorismate mutase/prephenate dehydrogenase [Planctomycetota bacterium]
MEPPSSETNAGCARSLTVLRAMIDSVDRELLRLLARRFSLIGEVAEYKRDNRVPIRDFQREREILEDRRHRATPLGLSPELVESAFRLIMWASRDLQATLKAEVPIDIEPRTVAVIGGKGSMGHCMAEMFADQGHAVMVADLDTQLTPQEAAATADVVVISVPIDATVDVIRQLGPLVRADALLMDVTSIKAAPVAAMLEASSAEVVGTHPLFGPSVHSLQGQRVVLCPARGDAWADWLRQAFRARGLVMMETTPEEHDHAMAVVQVLVHFSTEVLGRTLTKLDVSIEKTLAFTSPIYLMELLMSARHFAQSPDLYAAIQMSNPETPAVTKAFVAAAEELREIADGKDHEAFHRMFEEVGKTFGSFTDQALEQSSFLIDRLVERT